MSFCKPPRLSKRPEIHPQGRNAHLMFMLRLLTCLFAAVAAAAASAAQAEEDWPTRSTRETGRQVALVIGNGAYQNTRALPNPRNDAEDITRALQMFGFEVIALSDGSRRQMREKLAEFSRRIEGASAALVFYAGHGAQIRGENYLIPVDASVGTEAEIMDESISLNRVLDELDGARNRINIVMLDACRDNPVTGRFRNMGRGLAAPTSTPKGTVIVYATEPGNVASDGDKRNSPFTAGLMKAFQGSDLTLDGVLTVASAEVERTTNNQQVPYVNGPKTAQKSFRFVVAQAPGTAQLERDFWLSIQNSTYAEDFDAYMAKYPKGHFLELAKLRVNRLRNSTSRPAAPGPAASPHQEAATPTRVASGDNIQGWNSDRVRDLQKRAAADLRREIVDRACPDCPEMVLVPKGCFQMGSPVSESDRDSDEGPQRQVCLEAFELGRTEVTQAQWLRVMHDASGDAAADARALPSLVCGDCPMEGVSWDDAQEFLRRLNAVSGKSYRLPTEAEWEYAARAGTSGRYSVGNEITPDQANYYARQQVRARQGAAEQAFKTEPAGSLPGNPWGLHEMHGNVFEWVQDCYHDSYRAAPEDGSAWESDCAGPYRVFRGGSWDSDASALRSADRNRVGSGYRYVVVGFRLARTLSRQ
jgi:formylglycine-generating enzyme required for sulfatase activity